MRTHTHFRGNRYDLWMPKTIRTQNVYDHICCNFAPRILEVCAHAKIISINDSDRRNGRPFANSSSLMTHAVP